MTGGPGVGPERHEAAGEDREEFPGEHLAREAARVAPTLVGLTVAQATAEVAQHPGLTLRVLPPGTTAVSLDLAFGRIRVFTDRRHRVVGVMLG